MARRCDTSGILHQGAWPSGANAFVWFAQQTLPGHPHATLPHGESQLDYLHVEGN